jgi:hypothetical protein
MEALVAEGRFDRQLALVREHWAAARRLWLNTPEPLRAARLGDDLAPDFWFDTGLPGLAPVTERGHLFEFAEDGREALIVPCYDGIPGMLDANPERHVEELRDLVAVDLDRPERFWRRRGEALVLGNAYLEIAGQEGEPVPVFKNPISWLKSGGAGICVLDWNWARDLLLDHELIAEDLDLGAALEGALKPDIWVRGAAA